LSLFVRVFVIDIIGFLSCALKKIQLVFLRISFVLMTIFDIVHEIHSPSGHTIQTKRQGNPQQKRRIEQAAKRNEFLTHSRGRVDTNKRESIDSSVRVCTGVSPCVC
jgi:hypothetical protein